MIFSYQSRNEFYFPESSSFHDKKFSFSSVNKFQTFNNQELLTLKIEFIIIYYYSLETLQ